MTKGKKHNRLKTKTTGKGRGMKCWRQLSFWGKVWRVVWVALLSLWLFTLLQVLLGWFINPPLTPLMVQRFVQQVSEKDRKVNFERDYVPLDSISNNLITAVVYSEDGLFMYHHGFDVKQLKIAYKENQSGKRFRGGSTISNQTAKNAFLPHSRNMLRKVFEAYYTVVIEAVWGKRRIMEVYLNIVEFGDGVYGAEAAAQHYFGHSAKKLTRAEAARLAATLPAPLVRNPSHPTPGFKRHVSRIEQRFKWGAVDIDMPKDKRKGKYKDRETLVEFFFWRLRQK